MSVLSGAAAEVDEKVSIEEINEFNAQFLGYADRENGYAGKRNAISAQELATLVNLKREWNKNNPSDIIEIKFGSGGGAIRAAQGQVSIESYLNNERNTMEDFLTSYFKTERPEDYYFEFKTDNVELNEEGRIEKITFYMKKL